jgi:hypothetical protein
MFIKFSLFGNNVIRFLNAGFLLALIYSVFYACLDVKAGSLVALLCAICWVASSFIVSRLWFSLRRLLVRHPPVHRWDDLPRAMRGLIFGYNIGISGKEPNLDEMFDIYIYILLVTIFYVFFWFLIGGVTSMGPFVKKFFLAVYRKKHAVQSKNHYCQYDSETLTMFTSSLYLAALISSIGASTVTRKFGRKLSMLFGGVLFFASAIVNGFAQAVWMLIVG